MISARETKQTGKKVYANFAACFSWKQTNSKAQQLPTALHLQEDLSNKLRRNKQFAYGNTFSFCLFPSIRGASINKTRKGSVESILKHTAEQRKGLRPRHAGA